MTSLSALPVRTVRDLTILELDPDRVMVVACDSIGGIGSKPQDSYPATAATVAHFAARVPLIELLAAGAVPQLIVDALSVEMDPTGKEMIEEFRNIGNSIGLSSERITGSTEDNVTSIATGVGVTVLGLASAHDLRPGTSQDRDNVLCLGLPTSAPHDEVYVGHPDMVPLDVLGEVLAIDGVHDALPVGSHGIRYELAELAATAGLTARETQHALDSTKSGGPASCVLLSLSPEACTTVTALLSTRKVPHTLIGTLSAP
ncbi:hypothetical protein V6245_10595 [Salinibacterium amurskyense]|uniref:hypothetical protein n=1 Tax=Salinibacterium amurskyense TaxID=205941 RepID=UPI00311FD702